MIEQTNQVPKRVAPGRTFPILLAALTATTALSIDMSLPALPELAKAFHAPVNAVQLTLSLFLVGYAAGQLVCGPISDKLGRRPVMMAALLVYSLAGLACAFSPSLTVLVAARLVQGLAASAGPVIGRAMVRDCYGHREAAGILSQMTQLIIAVPLVAPMLGGYLLVWFGWPSIFLMLGGCGLILWAVCRQLLPETLVKHVPESPPAASAPAAEASVARWWHGFVQVLSHRVSLRHLLTGSFAYAGMFAYISGLPFLVIDVFRIPRQHFAYFFALTALALLAGASVNRHLLPRHAPIKLLRFGATCVLSGGLLMLAFAWFHLGGLPGVIGPMMLYIFGQGLVLPNAMALGMAAHGRLAGVASSLMGATQTGGGALAGYAVGLFYNGTSLALASVVATMAALSFLSMDRSRATTPSTEGETVTELECEGELVLHESGG